MRRMQSPAQLSQPRTCRVWISSREMYLDSSITGAAVSVATEGAGSGMPNLEARAVQGGRDTSQPWHFSPAPYKRLAADS